MDAGRILQSYLDEIAEAVMAGDFEAYREGVTLPFHLVTHTQNVTLADEPTLRAAFDTFRSMLQSQRVTNFIRLINSAQSFDETLIAGRYVTHLIAGSLRIIDPFHSQITLRHVDGRWRAASITNALANSRWPELMANPAPADPLKGPDQ
jgi:hypothetical protein